MIAAAAWVILLFGITLVFEIFYCFPLWLLEKAREWRKDRSMRNFLNYYR